MDQSAWNGILRRDDPALFNRIMLLWASSKLPGLLSSEERAEIVTAVCKTQEPDGSWKLARLGYWGHTADLPDAATGDGYATGLIAYVMEQAGATPDEPHLIRALGWLAQHQEPATGMWSASSLNKLRDPASNVGKFMSDAATAYAVLALTGAQHH
jgi:squalene-hopene/tetraprenyl-beta-curcumene cyclase